MNTKHPRLSPVAHLSVVGSALCIAVMAGACRPAAPPPEVEARRQPATATPHARIHFQSLSGASIEGYEADTGAAFDNTRGRGWVSEASLASANHVPLDMLGNGRRRNRAGVDPRTDGLMHMQYPPHISRPDAQYAPGAFELAVPPGLYRVTVSAGDQPPYDSTHVLGVEGTRAIDAFVPSAATEYASATVDVAVADGRLTIDAAGGVNTKLNHVDVDRLDGPELHPTVTSVSPANGATGITPATLVIAHLSLPNAGFAVDPESMGAGGVRLVRVDDGTALPGTLTLGSGGTSLVFTPDALLPAATELELVVSEPLRDQLGFGFLPFSSRFTTGAALPPPGAVLARVNFQPASSPVPEGYVAETGLPFDEGRGAGWVREDSLSAAARVPLDLSANTRDRARGGVAPLLNTIIHLQYPFVRPPNVTTPGAYEQTLPPGSYRVLVGVGDEPNSSGQYDSRHTVRVEGITAIDRFESSPGAEYRQATVDVTVVDGRLTVDAIGGVNTKLTHLEIFQGDGRLHPAVTSTSPSAGATSVDPSGFIAAEVRLVSPGGGIDRASLPGAVQLVETLTGLNVAIDVNTSAGGDVIVARPRAPLKENTAYLFSVSSAVKDFAGVSFLPFSMRFTTGLLTAPIPTPVAFQKVALPTATGHLFSSVTLGPDHKLYAGTLTGEIVRFALDEEGVTGPAEVLTPITAAEGPRAITGLTFDPAATAEALVLWVAHGPTVPMPPAQAPDWSGKVTRLAGPALAEREDYVVNLPRSIKDHMTNSIAFRADEPNVLYLTQGSNAANGDVDNTWLRPERALTAAVLRVDVGAITVRPLDVKTEEGGGYDPFAAGAPLTVYASGVRNAYDLVFHSNGSLYVPTNGSAAHGNGPATPVALPEVCSHRIDAEAQGPYTGPVVPALVDIAEAQPDFLFRVVQGGYYGHPNPTRCEWVLNGGNPTAGADGAEIAQYPVGVLPDRNYRGVSHSFGLHHSPNGVVEYRSDVFGTHLQGRLLVVRYSGGKDIVALQIDPGTGDVSTEQTGISGFTGFSEPLDLVEDVGPGRLYVTELGAQRITLLRPVQGGTPILAGGPARLLYTDVVGGAPSAPEEVVLRNAGTGPLTVLSLAVTGEGSEAFALSAPATPFTLAPGASRALAVTFGPSSSGTKRASLVVGSDGGELVVRLRGLGVTGLGGSDEPSLQRILDAYDIAVSTGDPDPATTAFPGPEALLVGDEVAVPRFARATEAAVTIEPLALFGVASAPAVRVGHYTAGVPTDKTPLFTVASADAQRLAPRTTPALVGGVRAFDPGPGPFGLYAIWPGFSDREVFTEDALNTFHGTLTHHARVFPLKDEAGLVVPQAYVVTFEEFTDASDFQDIVLVVRNVVPVPEPRLTVENLERVPFRDRLVTCRIAGDPAPNRLHSRATLRLHAAGGSPLVVATVAVNGPWVLVNPPALPLELAPGATVDLTVEQVASGSRVVSGSLLIGSNDPAAPSTTVQLGGVWMTAPEGDNEPDLIQIAQAFGYGTQIVGAGQSINRQGRVEAVGDEVISAYFRAADPTLPVTVRQIAAYHTQGNGATVSWHSKGSNSTSSVVSMNGAGAQSFFPRRSGSTTAPAVGTFRTTGVFGFKIDSEWSDPMKNNSVPDVQSGCTGACGHHVRFWPAKDRAGQPLPGTYLMSMDYAGINYDYNDNVYLLTNVVPERAGVLSPP